jgi:uncharacterized protein involved in response to NO
VELPPIIQHETKLQRAVTAFIVTGLVFLLLPGTFLGVWNLISISNRHQLESLSPAWLQAHGHAQVYGWIGTFILGIGFYSLTKMGDLPRFAVGRAWLAYIPWTCGVALRWVANVTGFAWRFALPLSAVLEVAGFLVFLATVSRHKPDPTAQRKPRQPWMLVVMGSTFGFLFALLLNLWAVSDAALRGATPAISAVVDQRLLAVPVWSFLVPAVWGFNARWLPIFLGLKAPNGRQLLVTLALSWSGAVSALAGYPMVGAALVLSAAILSVFALHIFHAPEKPAKTIGVHPSFPAFVKIAYVWLVISTLLTVWAAAADQAGGIWGASRHALTVGFLGTMVFSIGSRILPAFCGARVLFSKSAMFGSLLLLNAGCALRVLSEIPAYEGFAFAQWFWRALPVSAVTELSAVTLFAANLFVTFCRPPAHLAVQAAHRQKRVFA